MVQFGAIIFRRTFKNCFGQFVWIEKNRVTIIVAFHFKKRRLLTIIVAFHFKKRFSLTDIIQKNRNHLKVPIWCKNFPERSRTVSKNLEDPFGSLNDFSEGLFGHFLKSCTLPKSLNTKEPLPLSSLADVSS